MEGKPHWQSRCTAVSRPSAACGCAAGRAALEVTVVSLLSGTAGTIVPSAVPWVVVSP